ncbi:ubiquitin-protein ligase (E3) [Stygiomarasmius scandens]|uniref:Ubiquitin-protein ligase (E3) n=1 Tax=Marasmiellus scandens TaxID=2682957 RepID=A0ABR1J9Z5_9AGAR
MLSPPREDHDEDHRSSSSAVQIQSWWRALKARNLLRSIFDRDPGSLTGLKALFFLRHDDTRLKIWSTIIKERGGLPQCHPDQKSSWIILVKPIARRICKNVTSRPLSLQTMPHLEVLHTLLVPSAASEDQITKKDRQGVIMYLMRHGGYNELYKVMVSIPPKKDHDFQVPLLTLLVPLLTSHFHILSTTPSSRPYLTCLQDIFTQLLTVPVLANRFTGALELLTTFSADLGFVLNEMHKLSQSLPEIISGMTLDSKVHLLANLMVFTPVRYTAMPLKSFDVYLRLLALLIHDVPEAFLRAPVTEDSWIVNVQHADVARDIDPITQKHLFILLSLGHTSQILESRSNPEISASSIDCLTNLYFYWAVKREKVLRAIVSAQAWDIASFLYRARVRENPLGKVEAARIAGRFNLTLKEPQLN